MTMLFRLSPTAAGTLLAGLVLSCLIPTAQAQSSSSGDQSAGSQQFKIVPIIPKLPIQIPIIYDHRKPRPVGTPKPWPRPVVRDHSQAPGGVVVTPRPANSRPVPIKTGPVVRDHRTPAPAPVVRDHRQPNGGVIVRDHRTVPAKATPVVRDHRTPSPRPAVRDHRK